MKADEISSIIKERIENFELNVDIEESGKDISVADGGLVAGHLCCR